MSARAMKFSKYILNIHTNNKTSSLEGILLEEAGAYSLIQPWTSLGDLSLAEHLADLKGKHELPLTVRALELLEKDKKAKSEKFSLVPKLCPASHILLTDVEKISEELKQGVQTFKIKIGDDLEKDLEFLKSVETKMTLGAFRLRLDANLKFSAKTADSFFSQLSEKLLCTIDFVEDPIKGTEEEWLRLSERFDLRLAHDFAPNSFRDVSQIWVLKPSRENPWPWVEKAAHDMRRVVVTTALDHPLGHLIAASEAQQIALQHPLLIDDCGLLSFENLEIQHPFKRKGAMLDCSQLKGMGWGFDFTSIKWESL